MPDCRSCLGTGAAGVDEGEGFAAGRMRVWDARDCTECDGTGIDPTRCHCGEEKRREDRQCQGCRMADEVDEAYDRARDREILEASTPS